MVTQTVPIRFRVPADAERWTPRPETVEAMIRCVVDNFDPWMIVIFGSVARDEVRRDSDVDLLVVLDDVSNHGDMMMEVRRVLRPFLVAKDIVVVSHAEIEAGDFGLGSVLRPALREGVVAYSRT